MYVPSARPEGRSEQDWSAYYSARLNETPLFRMVLGKLAEEVAEPEHVTGRHPFPLKDIVFSLVSLAYADKSAARFHSELRAARDEGLITVAPSPNTLCEYLRDESLTALLQGLVTKSSLPLAGLETVFAVDSTGFGIPTRRDWFNRHKDRWVRRRDYIKTHVMVGVESNIITCAVPSEFSAHDSQFLKPLVEGTARYFELAEVSADAAYSSGENREAVLRAGAMPYIAYARTSTLDADYKSWLWKDMLYLHKTRHRRHTEHYYMRNNVESAFSALKAKFGERLRSRSRAGQFNEALCKVLCHNICVLIRSMHESGIDPTAWVSVAVRKEGMEGVSSAQRERLRNDFAEIKAAAAGRPALAKKLEAEREAASFKAAEKEAARLKAGEKKTAEQARRPKKAKRKASRRPDPQTQAALF